jgi:hypothetical protein
MRNLPYRTRFIPVPVGQKKVSGLCLLLMTLVFLLTFVAPVLARSTKPVISFTSVDPGKTQIDINGMYLHDGSNNPIVILGLNGKGGTTVDIPLVVDAIDAEGIMMLKVYLKKA